MEKHDMLMSPLQITPQLRIKNRIVKSPQSTWFWEADGTAGDRALAFYEALAKGGTGMIVLSAVLWTPLAGGLYCALHDDKYIPALKRFVDTIHQYDCKIICQLHHPGPSAAKEADGGPPAGPSALDADNIPIPQPLGRPTRELTLDEIEEHKRRYLAAAVRAKEVGFDGLEVHAAHGYFLESFISKVWNQRTDKYGCQNWENRTRLVVEIFHELRQLLGSDFPIGTRYNGEEWGANGAFTIEEAVELGKTLEAAGADYISVSGYGFGPMPFRYLPDYWPYPEPEEHMKPFMQRFEKGILIEPAERIRKAVKIPVIVAGRMDDDRGEKVLREGKADMIAIGRGLWADPELPNKVREGRIDDIVRCTRCGSCENPVTSPRKCRVNPSLGYEREYAITPASTPKNVMIIGAGPAGMEAARVAHLRGHNVTLYDKADALGGRLDLAAMIKGTDVENVLPIKAYLTRQIKKLGIRVRLNTEVTPELVMQEKPDVVLIATGGQYTYPDVPGIGLPHVTGVKALAAKVKLPLKLLGPRLLNSLTHFFLPVGKDVVILGGQIEGLQGAVFMKKRGRNVTVLEPSETIGGGIPEKYLIRLPWWFQKRGVRVLTGVRYEEITPEGVVVTTKEGQRELVPGSTVMVLTPQEPDVRLADALKGLVEVHVLGSTGGAESGLMIDALADGRRIGVLI